MKLSIIVLMVLQHSLAYGQISRNKIKIFALSKTFLSNATLSPERLERLDGADSIVIYDSAAYLALLNIVKDSSLYTKAAGHSIDLRMLIKLEDQPKTRIGLSRFNRVLLNTQVFDMDNNNVLSAIRKYIPPDLNWYPASEKEIKDYKKVRMKKAADNFIKKMN